MKISHIKTIKDLTFFISSLMTEVSEYKVDKVTAMRMIEDACVHLYSPIYTECLAEQIANSNDLGLKEEIYNAILKTAKKRAETEKTAFPIREIKEEVSAIQQKRLKVYPKYIKEGKITRTQANKKFMRMNRILKLIDELMFQKVTKI